MDANSGEEDTDTDGNTKGKKVDVLKKRRVTFQLYDDVVPRVNFDSYMAWADKLSRLHATLQSIARVVCPDKAVTKALPSTESYPSMCVISVQALKL